MMVWIFNNDDNTHADPEADPHAHADDNNDYDDNITHRCKVVFCNVNIGVTDPTKLDSKAHIILATYVPLDRDDLKTKS